MATYDYVELPLYSDSFYSYSVGLEEQTYTIEILYNERQERWHMSLFDQDGEALVRGVTMVPQYPLLKDINTDVLTGFFWLTPIAVINTEKYQTEPESLNQYYKFKYITNFFDD